MILRQRQELIVPQRELIVPRHAPRRNQRGSMMVQPYRFGGAANDPNFANVVLLLHLNGANGSTTFTDNSTNGFTPAIATGCSISTSQSQFGGASCTMTGGTNVGLKYNDNAAFTLGTSNWVFECFARFADTGTRRFIVGQSDGSGANTSISLTLQRTTGNRIRGFCASGSSVIGDITGTIAISSGVWYYLAYGREGSTFRLFVNAVADGTASSASSINNSTNQLAVGGLGEFTSDAMSGFIDEVRYTVGVYRDIATLGVPTGEFPNS